MSAWTYPRPWEPTDVVEPPAGQATEAHDPLSAQETDDPAGGRGTELIHYVMDLEALIRWFALAYAYEDQEGNQIQNEPIWTVYDERGNYLPENDRLQRTWNRVFHPEDGST